MDPGAVAMGLWQFGEIGNFYNVPLSNFIGWGVFGVVGLSLIKFFKIDTDEGYLVSLMALLGFWTTYTLFIGLYIPAVLGAILLLLFVTTTDWVEAKFIK